MPTYELKTPKRLDKVEIIRAEDIVIKDTMTKVPFLEIHELGIENIVQETFDDIIVKDIDILIDAEQEIRDRILETKKHENKPKFSEQFTIANLDEPVQISLSKVPEEAVPISEVQEEVQHAYDRGFDDGQQVTISTFKAELETHQQWVKNFDNIVSELHHLFSDEMKKFEESLAHLSTMVAEQIIQREITANSNIILDQIKRAIESVKEDKLFRIRVNPENYEILKDVKSDLLSEQPSIDSVEIVEDVAVDKGGCVLETSVGIVDSRIRTQLEKFSVSILNTIKNSRKETEISDMFNEELITKEDPEQANQEETPEK